MVFQSIVIEGGDQVGKGDVVSVLSRKFNEEEIPFYKIAFPCYATPIGLIIRTFLKEGIDNIRELEGIKGTKRELEIRILMYAINRLEALESILRQPLGQNDLVILDRSTYSHALTISYGFGGLKNISIDEVRELVNFVIEREQIFIENFNLDNCVIRLKTDDSNSEWKSSRIDDSDQYETKDVQAVIEDVYSEFGQIVGDGWCDIVTNDGEWREREDIYNEVRAFVESRINLNKVSNHQSTVIDTLEIARDIYGVDLSTFESIDKYYTAIEDCNKGIIYQEGLKMGNYITQHFEKIEFRNKDILNSIRSMFREYPECYTLIEHYANKPFADKFREVLNE